MLCVPERAKVQEGYDLQRSLFIESPADMALICQEQLDSVVGIHPTLAETMTMFLGAAQRVCFWRKEHEREV